MNYLVGKRYIWHCWSLFAVLVFIGTEVYAQTYFIANDQLITGPRSLKHAMAQLSDNKFAVISYDEQRNQNTDMNDAFGSSIRIYTVTDSNIVQGGVSDNYYRLNTIDSSEINEEGLPIQQAVAKINEDLFAAAVYTDDKPILREGFIFLPGSFVGIYSVSPELNIIENDIHIHSSGVAPSFHNTYDQSLIKLDDDTLVLAYAGHGPAGVINTGNDGIIKTFSFNISPTITVGAGSALEYSDRQGRYNSLVKFADDIAVLAYRYHRGGGRLTAFRIPSDNSITEIYTLTHNYGNNTPPGNILNADAHKAWYNSLVKLDSNTVALAYSGHDDGKGYLKIFDVAEDGTMITEMHNLIHVDTNQAISHNSMVKIDENTLALAYRGGSDKAGFIKIFNVANSTITEIAVFKHDENMGSYNSLIKIDDNTLALAYGGEIKRDDITDIISFTPHSIIKTLSYDSALAVLSVTASGGPYKADDTVTITVTFNGPARVTGTPSLRLNTGGTADYISGSGSPNLVFNYIVEQGTLSAKLNYAGINSLELNGSSIVSTTDPNVMTRLTLPEISSDRSLGGSDIMIDAIIPIFISGTTSITIINAATETVVYDANATDNGGRLADVGITYTLDGTNADLFNIDATSGTVTYRNIQNSVTTHNIVVIAADAVDNTATQTVTIYVVDTPTVTITDDINRNPDIANIADNDIIFTFTFSEPVDDFTIDDIAVSEGNIGSLTVSNPKMIWNLPVTPSLNTNNGQIMVTVTENAARSNLSGIGNNVTSAIQMYDTLAPNSPTINDIADDNIINAAETTSMISGKTEADTTVSLSFSGMIRMTDVTDTTWRYTLTNADVTAMGEGEETITATATDTVGNPSQPSTKDIEVDTVKPTVTLEATTPAVTTGSIINASSLTFTITFSEAVTNVEVSDISVTGTGNLDMDSLEVVSNQIYTFSVDYSMDGESTISIPADSAYDNAGNGNEMSDTYIIIFDRNIPTIDISLAVLSVTASGGPYKADDTVTITVTFNGPARVTGTPSLRLNTGGTAYYISGSESPNLVFNYIVEQEALSTKLNYAGINSLELNGSSIVSTTDPNMMTRLTLPEISSDRSLGGSDIMIDAIIPIFISGTTSITIINAATETVVYDANATDNGGRLADVGITYTLDGTDADLFNIDATSGTVTYRNIQNSVTTHNIVVIAADAVDNTATQTVKIYVVDTPTLTITDDINRNPDIANIADNDIIFTFTFSEPVDDFTIDDIEVSGGNIGSLTVSNPKMVWNLPVTPFPRTNSGEIMVTVMENAARSDLSGIGNSAASVIQTYDTLAPNSPTINDIADDNIINAAETTSMISGKTEADTTVSLSFSGMIRMTDVTDTTWRYTLTDADVTAMGEGEETITATATDTVGNPSQPSTKKITVDTVKPTVTLEATTPAVTTGSIINASSLAFTITFSEAVTNFEVSDISVTGTGGDLDMGSLDVVSNQIYTFSLDYSMDGESTISIPADSAYDNAGNGNEMSDAYIIIFDRSIPTIDMSLVVLSVTASGGPYKAGDTVTITVRFNGPARVTGTPSLRLNTGGTAYYISGSESPNLVFNYIVEQGTPSTKLNYAGINSLELNGSSIVSTTDPNVMTSLMLSEISSDRSLGGSDIMIDTIIPIFISGTTSITTINAAAETVVYDANATDNGGIADVGISYTLDGTNADLFNIDATSGTVTYQTIQDSVTTHNIVVIAADAAGNTATQTVKIYVVDTPTVTITDDINRDPDIANIADNDIIFTFTFSEPVDDFTIGGIEVSGGNIGSLTVSNPKMVWNLPVTPFPRTNSGEIMVTVMENAARSDLSGIGNSAASVIQTYDTLAPNSPTINDIADDNIINAAETTSMISGKTEADTTVSLSFSGMIRMTDVTDTTWRYTLTDADVTDMGEGEETITATATDTVGNPSQPSTKKITVDTVKPTVTLEATTPAVDTGNTINVSSLTFTVTFSEAVTGFGVSDISVTGTTGVLDMDSLDVVSNQIYTFSVDYSVDGESTISIPADSADDAAGNGNEVSNSYMIRFSTIENLLLRIKVFLEGAQ